jgi:hypothetical protein
MQRVLAVVLVLLILALIGLGLYAACGTGEGALQCVRDIAIIVLVVETFVVTLLMLFIVLLFAQLISTLQKEILPVIRSAKQTVDTVQGTTAFVSDTLVSPLIAVVGFGSGIRGALSAILGRRNTRRS